MRTPPLPPAEVARRLDRLQGLVRVLDEAVPIPGTGLRFGVDAVVGLVPVLGDVLGAGASLVILVEAARLGASARLLFAMAGNVALEALVGIVPFLGDAFDVIFRANRRNLTLLESFLQHERAPALASPWFVLGLVLALLVLLAFLAIGAVVGLVAVLRSLVP